MRAPAHLGGPFERRERSVDLTPAEVCQPHGPTAIDEAARVVGRFGDPQRLPSVFHRGSEPADLGQTPDQPGAGTDCCEQVAHAAGVEDLIAPETAPAPLEALDRLAIV